MTDEPSSAEVVAAMLEAGRNSRVSWARVAAILAAHGVVGRDGRPLKPNAVRMAYRRMQKRQEKAARLPKPEAPAPEVVVELPAAGADKRGESFCRDTPREVSAGRISPDAEDRMTRLEAQLTAGKAKMPKPIR